MAIISFTNYKRGQTTGCMGAVMRYTMQDLLTTMNMRSLGSMRTRANLASPLRAERSSVR